MIYFPCMKLIIKDTYEMMAQQVAADMLDVLRAYATPLICPASGTSPTLVYNAFYHLVQQQGVDTSTWHFIGLDEWMGMNGGDKGSCRQMLDEQLFHPLQVSDENIFFFDGKALDVEAECRKAENFIGHHGGIHLAIVGIGMNGHIGMNEPGTPVSSRSHVAAIHPVTQKVGQKYFSEPRQLDAGMTLGLGTLLESQRIFLIANGSHKAEIIRQMIAGGPDEQLPATLLKNHPGLSVYLDKEAAALI